MAQRDGVDPLEVLISDGRVRPAAYTMNSDVVVLDVCIQTLYTRINSWCLYVFQHHQGIPLHYGGTRTETQANITADIGHMVTFLLWNCYNRLRRVAERYAPSVRIARLNPRAPTSNRMEFPTYLSSLVQSIGPLHIPDGPSDILVIYAPPDGTMANFGRNAPQNPSVGNYNRFIEMLRSVGIPLAPIDMTVNPGSAWTTCEIELDGYDNSINVVGTIHRSHYTNEDVIRSAFLGLGPTENPFQAVGLTVSYVANTAIVNALANAPPQPAVAGQNANSDPRPNGIIYPANYYGLRNPIEALAVQRGCFILGRGYTRMFATFLAQQLTAYERFQLVRDRLLHSNTPANN